MRVIREDPRRNDAATRIHGILIEVSGGNKSFKAYSIGYGSICSVNGKSVSRSALRSMETRGLIEEVSRAKKSKTNKYIEYVVVKGA